MAPKKNKNNPLKPGKGPPPKPKKIPPPPACFGPGDLFRFKELFKAFDEDRIDAVKLEAIPVMLRTLGFNPKGDEIKELFRLFLEDDLVDVVYFHEWLLMIEAKMNWGDDFEKEVTKAFATLGLDDDETGICDFEKIREELLRWGEPLSEQEVLSMSAFALRDKTYNSQDGTFYYAKFIENMNKKDTDTRYIKEPIDYFKLDQKTLAELAIKKARQEREAQEKKEAERRAREEARLQKMIEHGMILPEENKKIK